MKYPFVLLLIIICGHCIGQKDTIAAKKINPVLTIVGDVSPTTFYPKQDTIKVLMLVCDTSYKGGGIIYLREDGAVDQARFNSIWWQFGYEVKRYFTGAVDIIINGVSQNHIQIEYLDQYKKPLPNNIVVWITKEIK